SLPAEMAEAGAPGTYGGIRTTLGHIVGAEEYYAFAATGLRPERPLSDEGPYSFEELRRRADEVAARWATLFRAPVALDRVVEFPPPGGRRSATLGVIVAQALNHAAEHRAQVATVLGQHGIDPPDLGAWAFGVETGDVELR